jgi:hypothetical protein
VRLEKTLPFGGLWIKAWAIIYEVGNGKPTKCLVGRRAIETISYTHSALHLRILVKEAEIRNGDDIHIRMKGLFDWLWIG